MNFNYNYEKRALASLAYTLREIVSVLSQRCRSGLRAMKKANNGKIFFIVINHQFNQIPYEHASFGVSTFRRQFWSIFYRINQTAHVTNVELFLIITRH